MIISSSLFKMHVIHAEALVPNAIADAKLSTWSVEIDNAASHLIKGQDYSSEKIEVKCDDLPFCDKSIIGLLTSSSDRSFRNKMYRESDVVTRDSVTGLIGMSNLGQLIHCSCMIKNIEATFLENGIRPNSSALNQLNKAKAKRAELLEVPICLANSSERIIRWTEDEIELMQPGDVRSNMNFAEIRNASNASSTNLADNKAKVVSDCVKAGFLEADVDELLLNHGQSNWHELVQANTLWLKRNHSGLLTLDDLTAQLVDRDASALFGLLPSYVSSYFTGPADACMALGSKTLIRDMKKLGLHIGKAKWIARGEGDYLRELGFERGNQIAAILRISEEWVSKNLQFEVGIESELSATRETEVWADLPCWMWPDHLRGNVVKIGNFIKANGVSIEFESEYIAETMAASVNIVDDVLTCSQHLTTIMSVLRSVSFVDDARYWLNNPAVPLKDASGLVASCGFDFVLSPDAIFSRGK